MIFKCSDDAIKLIGNNGHSEQDYLEAVNKLIGTSITKKKNTHFNYYQNKYIVKMNVCQRYVLIPRMNFKENKEITDMWHEQSYILSQVFALLLRLIFHYFYF